eukprot:CAMPEP_0198207650 /NCGR_PEP_ID=MMETSP1445-20131203/11090_1 /TAXON_ID=36898 /ORGANISM="Pyramimonas sp., Strain CCMP2087" /LENGTH=68 /DNA_ID=CAMNT_0043880765 /DNA_START=77 /DNA_END=280 /DNA_ORIENTATION=-
MVGVLVVGEAVVGEKVCHTSLRVTFEMLAGLKNVSSADDDDKGAAAGVTTSTSTSALVSPVSDSAPAV